MDTESLATGEKVAIVGAILTIIGAPLDWVTTPLGSVSGLDGDGTITLILAIIAGGLIVFRDWNRLSKIAVGVLGGLVVIIAANVYGNLESQTGLAADLIEAGAGLHITLVGGLILVIGAAQGYRDGSPDHNAAPGTVGRQEQP